MLLVSFLQSASLLRHRQCITSSPATPLRLPVLRLVFLPLHPTKYAELLGKKLDEHGDVNVWLVNTGWTEGPYGVGHRMSLKHTRAMITAAMNGELNNVEFEAHPVFGVLMPKTCPNAPSEILNPRDTWTDKEAYDKKANELAQLFVKNFEKYASQANDEIRSAAPKVMAVAE